MKYLFIKFFRDIKGLWSQFFSVFAMAVISLMIFAGMSSVWTGMEVSSEQYFSETDLADLWVYAGNITEEKMDELKELSYVENGEESMTFVVQGSEYEGISPDIRLATFDEETKDVMNPLIRQGEPLYEETEGIWLDEDYAKAHEVSVGDEISLYLADQEYPVTVKGTVLDAEYIYFVTSGSESVPDHEQHGYGYISEQYAQKLLGGIVPNQIRVCASAEGLPDMEDIREDMEQIFGADFYYAAEREDMLTIWQVVQEQEQIQKMAILFSAVFILLSLLTMYTTMSRLVNNQIVQIGTMKALGFSNGQIYFHYALYGLSVSLLGGILGSILGMRFISGLVLNIKKSTLTMPEWRIELAPEVILLLFIMVAICTLAALITAGKVIKAAPAQSIRGNVEQKTVKGKKMKRSRLSYEWIWVIRSLKMHPARFLMGIIAVMGSLILMVAGVGMKESLNSSYEDVFAREYSYQYTAQLKSAPFETIKEEFANTNVQYGTTLTADFEKDSIQKSGVVTILSEGDYIHLYNGLSKEKEELDLPAQGAFMNQKMAKQLDIQKGDTVTFQLSDSSERKEIEVVQIIDAKLPQGIFISAEAWERTYDEEFLPDSVYLGDDTAYDMAQESSLVTGITPIENQKANLNTMLDSINSIVYILILAAFVLSAVILYNLGTLNFIERYREYATMKVLGFYEKEIRHMTLKDCLTTLLPGIILGIPASLIFLSVYVEVVSMENMEWTPYIAPLHFLLILCIIVAFSIALSLLVCSKTKHIDMVEALKSID